MSEYDITKDGCLEKHYIKELDLLRELNYPYDEYKTFWIWIAELLTECFNPDMTITGINDNMGMIMYKIKGSNLDCNEMLYIVQREEPGYDKYLAQYRIAKRIDESGMHYKELYSENNESTICKLIELFSDYVKSIAPYVYEETVKQLRMYRNNIFNDERIAETKKNYRRYIAKYNGMIKEFKNLLSK